MTVSWLGVVQNHGRKFKRYRPIYRSWRNTAG